MSIDCVTKYVVNDEVDKILNSIAEEHHFKKFYCEINDDFSKGDGHTGTLKSVKMVNANDLRQTLNLFVKISSRDEDVRKMNPITELYNTEIYMYDTILPYFRDLEIRKGLTPSIVKPNFYGSLLNDKNEVLILENLKDCGYKLHDKKTPMNGEHIRLVIVAFAKLHSLSLALRNQQPKMFENLQSKLFNSSPKAMECFKDVLIKKYTNLLNVLDEDCSKRIKNFMQNIDNEFKELLSPPIDEYSVVIHGDCWMNNILFQYLDGSCNPTDVCLIDYQASRLAPPILDLAYFFFASSPKDNINQCKEYLKLYYQILSTHLKKLECDPNKLYPYSVFLKQWNKFAKYSAIMAPLPLLVTMREENDVVDLVESAKTDGKLSSAIDRDTTNDKEYNDRVKTIISYLVKNDLL